MNRHVRGPVLLVVLAAALASAGCLQKAKPARPAGFIPPEELEKPADLPFHKAWRKAGTDWGRYREIYIAPLNTDYLREMSWWEKLERGEKVKEDAKELALYAQTTFREAFANDPNHRFQVVDLPGSNSLMAEIALTEVVPNKVVLDALGYAAGPIAGPAGSAAAGTQSITTLSTVAFEARMRDGTSKEVVAMFADRESEKYFPVNLKDLTWYGHAKAIIKEWADQFVKIANQQPGEIIKDSPLFDLKPW